MAGFIRPFVMTSLLFQKKRGVRFELLIIGANAELSSCLNPVNFLVVIICREIVEVKRANEIAVAKIRMSMSIKGHKMPNFITQGLHTILAKDVFELVTSEFFRFLCYQRSIPRCSGFCGKPYFRNIDPMAVV